MFLTLKQPNRTEELVSTTIRFTRMGKPSSQTANTSAHAWTGLLDAFLCARMSSLCPNWAATNPGWSKSRVCAVSNSSAQRTRRQRRSSDRRKRTSWTAMSCSTEGKPSLYLVGDVILQSSGHVRLERILLANECLLVSFFWIDHSPAFRSHSKGLVLARRGECVSHTTTWSPCSRSCGTGVSTRLTNRNTQCEMMKESRVCEIRPCSQLTDGRLKVHSRPLGFRFKLQRLQSSGCNSVM